MSNELPNPFFHGDGTTPGSVVPPWMMRLVDPTTDVTDRDGGAAAPYISWQECVDASEGAALIEGVGVSLEGPPAALTLPSSYVLEGTGYLDCSGLALGNGCNVSLDVKAMTGALAITADLEAGGSVALVCADNTSQVSIDAAETTFYCASPGTVLMPVGDLTCGSAVLMNCSTVPGTLVVVDYVTVTNGVWQPTATTGTIGGALALNNATSAMAPASTWTVDTINVQGGYFAFNLNSHLVLASNSARSQFQGVQITQVGASTHHMVNNAPVDFRSCVFLAALSFDNAAAPLIFDNASWQSFELLGGTVTTPANVTVIDGATRVVATGSTNCPSGTNTTCPSFVLPAGYVPLMAAIRPRATDGPSTACMSSDLLGADWTWRWGSVSADGTTYALEIRNGEADARVVDWAVIAVRVFV